MGGPSLAIEEAAAAKAAKAVARETDGPPPDDKSARPRAAVNGHDPP